jgi:hypothetical protein
VVLTWFYLDKVEVYYRNKLLKGEESLLQETDYPLDEDPVTKFLLNKLEEIKR